MKQFFRILLFFLCPLNCISETTLLKKQSLFLELGGSGGFGSINYEKDFLLKTNTAYSFRAGFCVIPIDKNNGSALIFPLMVNFKMGNSAHKLEGGVGQGLTVTTKGSAFALALAAFGYRYQPTGKRLFFKIAYTPLISYIVDRQIQHWGGLSIGYSFKSK